MVSNQSAANACPIMTGVYRLVIVLLICLCPTLASAADEDFSDDYDKIYQIRVVAPEAGGKSSIGSGFQVSANGLIITNYRVVSAFVQAPERYEIRYMSGDGQEGQLQLLDFDVVSDLALLRHPDPQNVHFDLTSEPLVQGEMLYALGNPGDWGVLMVPGPHNGFVEHSYEKLILFSGSLNPGMSGGPSLNGEGEVVGVNVATAGSQLSFLVPVDRVLALLDEARSLQTGDYLTDITDQIRQWQRDRVSSLLASEWPRQTFARRTLFGDIRHDFRCWGDTNGSVSDRTVDRVSLYCDTGDELYIDQDLQTGKNNYEFTHETSIKLNRFQFASSQLRVLQANRVSDFSSSTNFECHSDFLDEQQAMPGFVHVVTCLRTYRKLPGLYDSVLNILNQRDDQAYTAELSLSAMEADQIRAFNRRFIREVQ